MKRFFLLSILFIIIFFCSRELFTINNNYKISEEYYINIQKEFVKKNSNNKKNNNNPITTKKYSNKNNIRAHTTSLKPPISVDFKKIKEINKDIIGWIYSEDTPINYPVLHGSNNIKYLHRAIDGEYSVNGSIFLDSICNKNLKDDNLILYGHHMKNGSMFASLNNYKEKSYYNNHSQIWFLTPNKNYLIVPFAGVVVSVKDYKYFMNEIENKENFIREAVRKSFFNPIAIPNKKDRIITLCTCDYSFKNARFLLLGILIPSI